ncbi:MAG: ISNCY family transposase [Thermoplasmata archaeon]
MPQYKIEKEDKKRNWTTHEEEYAKRMEMIVENLRPLVVEATSTIQIKRGRGRKPKLSLDQKVLILLLKEISGFSKRKMAYMLSLFSLLSGIKVSPKMVERLYSDPLVEMALQNLFVFLLKKKGVEKVEYAGDGTGYALSIEKHYRRVATSRKKEAKEKGVTEKKQAFTYWFSIIDIKSRMYIAHGTSQKSEKEAFEKAMKFLRFINVEMISIRLDKYFSNPSYVNMFENVKVYVIPKKNATVRGGDKWRDTMKEFVNAPLIYLSEYFMRNHSEAAFSADKRMLGWQISQKREDRICTSMACRALWHNLFNLYSL